MDCSGSTDLAVECKVLLRESAQDERYRRCRRRGGRLGGVGKVGGGGIRTGVVAEEAGLKRSERRR